MSEERRVQQYQEAIDEAERFIRLAGHAVNKLRAKDVYGGSKETAAAKRASMDLSRALSTLRKGPWA
jgi:hypothetical protein